VHRGVTHPDGGPAVTGVPPGLDLLAVLAAQQDQLEDLLTGVTALERAVRALAVEPLAPVAAPAAARGAALSPGSLGGCPDGPLRPPGRRGATGGARHHCCRLPFPSDLTQCATTVHV